jgi:hypothetical protein
MTVFAWMILVTSHDACVFSAIHGIRAMFFSASDSDRLDYAMHPWFRSIQGGRRSTRVSRPERLRFKR